MSPRRRFAVALALAALCPALSAAAGQGDQAPARPDLPIEGVITNPDWQSLPNGDDLGDNYPKLAAFLLLSGQATIHCKVTSIGWLDACSVAAEQPKGFGFGDAALKMSSLFRMKPETLDGAPVGGAAVNIPINFAVPSPPTASPPTIEATPAPSSEAMGLARRLVAEFGGPALIAADIDKTDESLKNSTWVSTPEEAAAANAWIAAATAYLPNLTERMAADYAANMPVSEMRTVLTFLESPAGKDWQTWSRAAELDAEEGLRASLASIAIDARARLCGEIACVAGDASKAEPVSAPAPTRGR